MNMVSNTWSEVILGEICEFRYGKSLPEALRKPGPHPVFGSNGQVGSHTEALTDGQTIIIGRKGSIGEISYSPESCWPIDTTYFIDRSCTKQNIRWLSRALVYLRLTELNKSAAVPGLNREDAYRKKLLLPPLAEQRRIASILDQADDIRHKRQQAREKVHDLSRAMFVEMFGDPILNVRQWPTRKLGEVGELERGVSKHRPRNDPVLLNGPYPLIQTGDIANCDGYIRRYTSTYSEIGLRQSRLWPKGTLCITIAANIGKTGILLFDSCFPDSVVGFTPRDLVTIEYVQSWMSFVQNKLEDDAPEFAQKNINLAILRELTIPVPPIGLQVDFTSRIGEIDRLRTAYRTHLAKLDSLFASLQHLALRGELTSLSEMGSGAEFALAG